MTGQQLEPAYAAAMPAPQGGALPTGLEWQALERMATTLADSDVIPYRLKRKPADVAVILLAAREYGIPPLMALSKLPVVNGTPAPMGELMVALVLRAGHYIGADFRNPDGTVYKGGPLTPQHYGEARYKRRDWDEREVMTFTLEEALTAGLIDRIDNGRAIARVTKTKNGQQVEEVTPWEQYTPNMARWRAVANACRLTFPDVLLGLSYLPEELGAMVDADGAPIMGEVVEDGPRRRTTTTASLEERSAQEAADRLVDFVGPLEVLDGVEKHAADNGYADVEVTYHGDRMPLESAIDVRRAVLRQLHSDAQEAADTIHHGTTLDELAAIEADARRIGYLEAPIVVGGVDGTLDAYLRYARDQLAKPAEDRDTADVADTPAPETTQEAAQEAQEPPVAPSATEEPHDEAPAPQEAAQPPQGDPTTDPLELARAALEESDVEALRQLYRWGSAAGHLNTDVIAVIGDDDLAAVDLIGTVRLPLGAFLMRAASYVERHGNAIRDLG